MRELVPSEVARMVALETRHVKRRILQCVKADVLRMRRRPGIKSASSWPGTLALRMCTQARRALRDGARVCAWTFIIFPREGQMRDELDHCPHLALSHKIASSPLACAAILDATNK